MFVYMPPAMAETSCRGQFLKLWRHGRSLRMSWSCKFVENLSKGKANHEYESLDKSFAASMGSHTKVLSHINGYPGALAKMSEADSRTSCRGQKTLIVKQTYQIERAAFLLHIESGGIGHYMAHASSCTHLCEPSIINF